MKKALEQLEKKIESLSPYEMVELDRLLREMGKEPGLREAAIMLLEKYGIEYR